VGRIARGGTIVVVIAVVAVLAASAAEARPAGPAASSTAPRVWAGKVCSAVSTWQKQLTKRSASFAKLNGTSLPAIRNQLAGFFAGIVADTDALVAAVDRSGTPAVPHGADIRRTFRAALVKTRTLFAADVRRAKRLPVDSPAAFTTGVSALGKALAAQGATIAKAFGGIEKQFGSTQLTGAMRPVPACTALTG
jgi:hypothetical protein